jgi:hypothetical protein
VREWREMRDGEVWRRRKKFQISDLRFQIEENATATAQEHRLRELGVVADIRARFTSAGAASRRPYEGDSENAGVLKSEGHG